MKRRIDLRLSRLSSPLFVLTLCTLAGCASSNRAPVENRDPTTTAHPATSVAAAPVIDAAPGAAASSATPAVARPGYHIVKRGETLYSIALEYGQDYRDVAQWNNLGNAAVIAVGQELRVLPPGLSGEITVAQPTAPAPIEVRPLDSSSSPATARYSVAPDSAIKQEPKGGRIPYSPQALKDLQTPASGGNKPAVSAPIAASIVVATPATSEPKATPTGDDAVEWMWPGNGKMVAGFNESTNKGVDIGGLIGDPVMAAGPGKVVYVGTGLRGYGNLVIIKHNNTFLSAYAHNSEILVKEGQTVQRGQKIATLGNSDADRPILHFEIRKLGKPVDPLKYLPAR